MSHYKHRPMYYKSTYIDLKYRERIFESDLNSKVADPSNGFCKVAELTEAKWNELETMAPNILSQRVDDNVKQDVLYGLLEKTSAEEILERWGIAPSGAV